MTLHNGIFEIMGHLYFKKKREGNSGILYISVLFRDIDQQSRSNEINRDIMSSAP